VLGELEHFLTGLLGNAHAVGAASWLQALTWIAALIAVFLAGISLRRNSLQSRAALLLNLYKAWDDLAEQRKGFFGFYNSGRHDVLLRHVDLQPTHQMEYMRGEFRNRLAELRKQNDPQFQQFTEYVEFFEILGMYVKNGYVPLRDVLQLYKGPILMIDVVWRNFIREWEKESHVPRGILEHAVFLMDMARVRSSRPFYYWTIYRFRRYLGN
jgi:hypothetical protein